MNERERDKAPAKSCARKLCVSFGVVVFAAGDGRLGLLGKHGQRAGGLHSPLRRVLEDPPAPPPQERAAGKAIVQEVGRGCAGVDIDRGGRGLYGE